MAIPVTFYSYVGRPNEVPKKLIEEKTINLEFITDERNLLEVVIELDDIETTNVGEFSYLNYLSFRFPASPILGNINSIRYYYFIYDVVYSHGRQFIYCHLDVLQTYFELFSDLEQIYEKAPMYLLTANPSLSEIYIEDDLPLPVNRSTETVYARTQVLDLNNDSGYGNYALTVADARGYLGTEVNFNNLTGITTYLFNSYGLAKFIEYLGGGAGALSNIIEHFSIGNPADFIVNLVKLPTGLISSSDIYSSPSSMSIFGKQIEFEGLSGNVSIMTKSVISRNIGNIWLDDSKFKTDYRYYPPQGDCTIYLPLLGFKTIDQTPYLKNDGISITYTVSLLTGETLVLLRDRNFTSPLVRDTFSGNIGQSIPLASSNIRQTTTALAGIALTSAVGITGNYINQLAGTTAALSSAKERLDNVPETGAGSRKEKWFAEGVMKGTRQGVKASKVSGGVNTANMITSAIRTAGWLGGVRSHVSGVASPSLLSNLQSSPYVLFTYPETEREFYWSYHGIPYMKKAKLTSFEQSGGAKIFNPQLPMYGIQVNVYNELVSILEEGFYYNKDVEKPSN